MIDFGRMTGNEREVLHAALKSYDSLQRQRAGGSKSKIVADDVRWRRYIVAELLAKIDAR